MSLVPGIGIVKGMALTLRRFFQPKVTVQYPEQAPQIPPRHRGRLQLLYDEHGALKCETCFQCAQACPIECIDMGGTDTKNRFGIHWGPPEQYAERREESALRRSGRVVPSEAYATWSLVDLGPLEDILEDHDYAPGHLLRLLERAQAAYGYLPVAVLKHISHVTGVWYAEIYGVASFYEHLRLDPPSRHVVGICRCPSCSLLGAGALQAAMEDALGVPLGQPTLDGSVSLEPASCHGDNAGSPYVVVDGERRTGLTPAAAADLARSLLPTATGRPA